MSESVQSFGVIGLGSMGKRRARLLKQLKDDCTIVGIDTDEAKRDTASKELGIEVYPSLEDAIRAERLQAAFVCSSPLSHPSLIKVALKAGLHVFTELNLVAKDYDEIGDLIESGSGALFVSSTFLYRKDVGFIRKYLSEASKGAYIYHVGQYLPDWHPWQDYRSFFVAASETSAIRELLAIELPWLMDVFGDVVSFKKISAKLTQLDLPYDDTLILLLEHESGNVGTLMIDVVSRKAVRNFEYVDEQRHVFWDGNPEGVQILDLETAEMSKPDIEGLSEVVRRDEYASFITEDAYAEEIRRFLSLIECGQEPAYSFEEDKRTLALIDEIEAAV